MNHTSHMPKEYAFGRNLYWIFVASESKLHYLMIRKVLQASEAKRVKGKNKEK